MATPRHTLSDRAALTRGTGPGAAAARRARHATLWLAALVVAAFVTVLGGVAPARAAGTIAISASPAQIDLKVGGQERTLSLSITASEDVKGAAIRVSVPLVKQGVGIKGTEGADCAAGDGGTLDCNLGDLRANQPTPLYVTLTPPQQSQIAPGNSLSGTGQLQATATGAARPEPVKGNAAYKVVLANDQPQSVGPISGKVVDADNGKAIGSATVQIKDSTGRTQQTTTDGDGNFSWSPSGDQTLQPGQITVTITLDGYKKITRKQNGTAGQPMVFTTIELAKKASPTPTKASPKPTHAKPTHQAEPDDGGGLGAFMWLLIILGCVLVVGGIVAIVMLIRKKDDKDDGGDPDGPLLPFGDTPPPAAGQNEDATATTVMAPIPANGPPPGNTTATVAHNGPLVRDEYDDYDGFARNYGTGNYQQPGTQAGQGTQYGGATQQYGGTPYAGEPAGQYGEPTGTWPGPNAAGQVAGGAPGTPAPAPGEPAQPWQQSDPGPAGGTYGGTTYGRGPQPGAAPTSGTAPTSGAYGGQPAGGHPGAAPTSGAYGGQPTSGAYGGPPPPADPYGPPQPPGGYGQQPPGGYAPPGPQPTSGGMPGGYGQPSAPPAGAPAPQYGAPYAGPGEPAPRRGVDDPTRTWQQSQQPNQQSNQQPQRRPNVDETRLDRTDGVDWLDG